MSAPPQPQVDVFGGTDTQVRSINHGCRCATWGAGVSGLIGTRSVLSVVGYNRLWFVYRSGSHRNSPKFPPFSLRVYALNAAVKICSISPA